MGESPSQKEGGVCMCLCICVVHNESGVSKQELEKFTDFFSIEFNYGQYRQKVQQLEVAEFQLPVL